MKLIFRLSASSLVGVALLVYVLYPADAMIVSPRLGQPAIVTAGESLIIHLKTSLPYQRPKSEITLVSAQSQQILTLTEQSHTLNEGVLSAVIPQTLAPGNYDLHVMFGDQALIRPKAVHVLREYPDEISIVQLADLPTLGGDGSGDKLLAELIGEINLINPTVVLFTGDLAYGGGNWYQYELLLQAMSIIDAPVIAAPGNHEYEGWSGYLTLLGFPYHSVTLGNYHFISLNSGHGRDQLTQTQFNWLQTQLENNDMRTHIIQLHHPVKHREELRGFLHHYAQQFSNLVERFEVPIVLSGHWHGDAVYDKNGNEYTDTSKFPGTAYVVTTAAGADLRENYSSSPLHHGYRLIRLKDSQLESYTYDYDQDGQRDPASSIPVGNLSVQYHSATSATIKNELAETFKEAKIRFQVPVSNAELRPDKGHIIQKYQINDVYHYEIGFDLAANSMVKIRLQ